MPLFPRVPRRRPDLTPALWLGGILALLMAGGALLSLIRVLLPEPQAATDLVVSQAYLLPQTPKPATAPVSLKVMTYNIRHAENMNGVIRPDAVLQVLRRADADVIALQEVDRWRWRSGLQDQLRYFARGLGMGYAYAPTIRSGLSQYGIALLSRYPLDAPRSVSLPGVLEPRRLLLAELRLPAGPVTVAVAHLGLTAGERRLQLVRTAQALQAVRGPLLVMGDFNMPASGALERGLARIGLQRLGPLGPATLANGERVDHLFARGLRIGPAAIWTGTPGPSDHAPVVGVLSLSGGERAAAP